MHHIQKTHQFWYGRFLLIEIAYIYFKDNILYPLFSIRWRKVDLYSFYEHSTYTQLEHSVDYDRGKWQSCLSFQCVLWNVEQAEPVNVISCHENTVFSMSWSQDGSLFSTSCKDKKLRIIDPRMARVAAVKIWLRSFQLIFYILQIVCWWCLPFFSLAELKAQTSYSDHFLYCVDL